MIEKTSLKLLKERKKALKLHLIRQNSKNKSKQISENVNLLQCYKVLESDTKKLCLPLHSVP